MYNCVNSKSLLETLKEISGEGRKMELNYFDLVVSIIILLLGLKGILNGLFKEAFGLIGIIGGLFVASRMGEKVGEYLNENIFHFTNSSVISFTGFLFTLAVFWLSMIALGAAFKKLSSLSGLGLVDRIFGFIFASGKFFLIASVIAFAVFNIKAIKPHIDKATKGSILFPILVETGGYIMKMDPTKMSNKINTTIDETTQNMQENMQKNVEEEVKKAVENAKETIKESTQEAETENATEAENTTETSEKEAESETEK